MTIERSHGAPRLTKPRLTDAHEGPTPQEVEQRREQLRQNAMHRGTKEAVRAPLRAVAGEEVRRALGSSATPEESRMVAQNALQLAGDAGREVASPSPFVAHFVVRYGVNVALAGFYTQKAAEVGFDSPRGLELIDAAHRCEARAERAMIAASAAVKTFAGKRSKALDATPWFETDGESEGTP